MGGVVFVRFNDIFVGLPGDGRLGVSLVFARGVSGLSTAALGGHTLPHFFDAPSWKQPEATSLIDGCVVAGWTADVA